MRGLNAITKQAALIMKDGRPRTPEDLMHAFAAKGMIVEDVMAELALDTLVQNEALFLDHGSKGYRIYQGRKKWLRNSPN